MTVRLAAFLSLLVVLAACGPATKQASAPSPTPTPVAVLNAAYLAGVKTAVTDEADSKLIEIGHALCESLDAGGSWVGAVKTIVDGGFTGRQAGALIASAVTTYCPKHEDLLPS